MSGWKRLAVFLSAAWLFAWMVLASSGYDFDSQVFAMLGVGPVATLWGAGWVVSGFRKGGRS